MKPLIALLLATATGLSSALAAGRASITPNILSILTDQHHARMLSSAGNPYLKTRALDSMAGAGIRFSRAYVCNPVCVPSRISMATGVMAGRFGVFNNGMKAPIPKRVASNSLGRLIKSGGYTDGVLRESLVDPRADPGEMENLAGLPPYQETLNRHRALLQEWIAESNDAAAKAFAIAPD